MKDRRDHRWGPAAAALLFVGFVTFYPLSLPVAVLIHGALGQPQWLEPILEAIYDPLMDMPEPMDSALQWYVDPWLK